MTFMDKILKDFGIERMPLVDTNTLPVQTVRVVPEHCDVETYHVQKQIPMNICPFDDLDSKREYLDYRAREVVEEVLDGISDQVKIETEDRYDHALIVGSIDIVKKKS